MRTGPVIVTLILMLAAAAQGQLDDWTFAWVDVYVDSGAHKLAAYQLEVKDVTGSVKIVGIGGGEHAAFRKEPYYDKAAMSRDHVILAAFSTGEDLPTGRTRVARVMVSYRGDVRPTYAFKLTTAATVGGAKITATVSIETGGAEQ